MQANKSDSACVSADCSVDGTLLQDYIFSLIFGAGCPIQRKETYLHSHKQYLAGQHLYGLDLIDVVNTTK